MTGKRGYIGGNFGLPHRDFSYDEAYGGEGERTTGVSNMLPGSATEATAGGASGQLPRVLSTWMPLTPVRTDNGCMCTHTFVDMRTIFSVACKIGLDLMSGALTCMDVRTDVLPAEFDSCFDKPGAFSHLRAATARLDEDEDTVAGSVVTECRFDLTAARPLAPAEPGDVCMWAGNSIHW
eukprot:COSAG02_NODE_132_length_34701_cov_707.955234_5_plen_180_part_00